MSCEGPPRFTRRRFMITVGAAAAAPAFAACMNNSEDLLMSDYAVKLSDYPDLSIMGKTVLIDVGLRDPLAITLTGPNTYIITSTECTHRGCEVQRDASGWTCPCHGSRFTLNGAVINGPAQAPLPKYNYTVDGGTLTIKAMS